MELQMMNTTDFFTIGVLIFLEGVLSIDNAIVLAVLARQVPEAQQKKVLTYGLVGAVVFRMIAIALASYLMHLHWMRFVGGGYLLYLSVQHFFFSASAESKIKSKARSFWGAVLMVELTDIAFAMDSILAAVALTQKYWVIVIGGLIGLVLMRFAAATFIKVLKRFPSFETSAYLLVALVGAKVVIEGFQFEGVDFHSVSSPWFIGFWTLLVAGVLYGFIPKKNP
jgi:YkoY family integral membrane protein